MHTVLEEREEWVPTTEDEKNEVRRQMERLLETSHFKNSRRYPALFRFIVEETLEGRGEFLKERLLGVRVFDRPADYDTAADPIVRVTIAEIRKRIAQYYHEEAHDSEMRIELLPGRYIPEFRPRRDVEDGSQVHVAEATNGVHEANPADSVTLEKRAMRSRRWVIILKRTALWLAIALFFIGGGYWGWRLTHPSAVDQLWHPILASREPVTFYLPLRDGDDEASDSTDSDTMTFLDHMSLGENVVFSDMLATQHISDLLAMHHHEARLRMNAMTTFEDLRQGPAILIGGLDNEWTMRAVSTLRYRFTGNDDTQYCIIDSDHPEKRDWCVRFKAKYPLVTHDYAIVARLHSPSTGQMEMIVAGIGMSGTAAAGEFLVNPQHVDDLRRMVGPGFGRRDFEAILSTDVVNGVAGSPSILAVSVW